MPTMVRRIGTPIRRRRSLVAADRVDVGAEASEMGDDDRDHQATSITIAEL